MSLIGACLQLSISRGIRKRRGDHYFSLSWHFLRKERLLARVPTLLAVGAVGPFWPRFRRPFFATFVGQELRSWQLRGVAAAGLGAGRMGAAKDSAVSGTGGD